MYNLELMIITVGLTDKDVLVVREIAAGETVFVETDDDALLRRLETECAKYSPKENRRMECWLVVENPLTLWTLWTVGLPEKITTKADVFAVTVEDWVAKTVLVKLPDSKSAFPSLDRRPITAESDSTVHLVIAGCTPQAQALALNAALVAHYPNYCRDQRLRTRITIIDQDIIRTSRAFLQRYSHLFANSYYRTLDLGETSPHCVLHKPVYEGKRKDFVDVEWEFVDGDIRDDAVRQKLREWSISEDRQLTLAICNNDHKRNIDEALSLPEEIYSNSIPVLCNIDDTALMDIIGTGGSYSNVYPFGRGICRLEDLRMLKNMAKRINHIYNYAFSLGSDETISGPASVDEALMDSQWDRLLSLPKVYSNYFNAMTLGTKMHSMGHSSEDWECYYALSRDEIEILMEVEHNRWNVEELILGYRPVTDEEQAEIEADMALGDKSVNLKRKFRDAKIHYDIRPYDDLRDDVTGKNVNVYDYVLIQSIPLIIKTCIAE